MLLKNPAFSSGHKIPTECVFNGYGCRDQNLVPKLKWGRSTTAMRFYVLAIGDSDAPFGAVLTAKFGH
jgi:phosphatidylethanolamine-binding protein (PEBP) family uncharacterized protein